MGKLVYVSPSGSCAKGLSQGDAAGWGGSNGCHYASGYSLQDCYSGRPHAPSAHFTSKGRADLSAWDEREHQTLRSGHKSVKEGKVNKQVTAAIKKHKDRKLVGYGQYNKETKPKCNKEEY